jgi:hypothetical protein
MRGGPPSGAVSDHGIGGDEYFPFENSILVIDGKSLNVHSSMTGVEFQMGKGTLRIFRGLLTVPEATALCAQSQTDLHCPSQSLLRLRQVAVF